MIPRYRKPSLTERDRIKIEAYYRLMQEMKDQSDEREEEPAARSPAEPLPSEEQVCK